MDPLSVAASIAALLQVAAFVYKCAKNIKKSSSDQDFFKLKLEHFIALLQQLQKRVHQPQLNAPWFEQIKLLCAPDGLFDGMHRMLRSLEDKIRRQNASRPRFRARLLWNLERDDLQSTLSALERLSGVIGLALQQDHFDLSLAIKVDTAKTVESLTELQAEAQTQTLEKAIEWLRPPDASLSYHRALQNRRVTSGQWCVNHPFFQEWIDVPSCFWLYGKPGCGKTVLSAIIVEQLLARCANHADQDVAHYFFESGESTKTRAGDFLRSLIVQFGDQDKTQLRHILTLYRKHSLDFSQPTNAELCAAVKELISTKARAYLVIDGLEESSELKEVLHIIRELAYHHRQNLHLIVTSRLDKFIKDDFESSFLRRLEITPDLIQSDIREFIAHTLENEPRLQKWTAQTREEILTTLTSKSDGMFQWVYCQLDELQNCITEKKLRLTLSTLPETLNGTYERLLDRIERDGYREEAIRILQWLCHARRPMRRAEIVDCLAVDLDAQPMFCERQRIPDPDDILRLCSSLITMRSRPSYRPVGEETEKEKGPATKEQGTSQTGNNRPECGDPEVRLSHFSVREFLVSSRCRFQDMLLEGPASGVITQSCLVYLLHLCKLDPFPEKIQDDYPLAPYAARFWFEHLNVLNWRKPREDILDSAVELLESHPNGLKTWRRICDIEFLQSGLLLTIVSNILVLGLLGGDPQWAQAVLTELQYICPDGPGSPLYYACLTGNIALVKRFLRSDTDLNVSHGGYIRFPMAAAQSSGQITLSRFLLSMGAKPAAVPRMCRASALVRMVAMLGGVSVTKLGD